MAPPPPIHGVNEYAARQTSSEHVPVSSLPGDLRLADGTPDYLRLILTSRVYDIITETPISKAAGLTARLGYKVLLKREDLQPVYSFKVRGAYNKIAHLPVEERWKGVVACSAGNHAQGVAYSAKRLGIPATIVMPTMTPSIKHSNVTRMGSKVVLHGNDFDEAKDECRRLELKHGLTNIPPFDDPYVIAGQGTIGMEILRQVNTQDLKAVFCCVGGGGLIAGVGVYLKRLCPEVKIIGVEARDANAMAQSLEKNERVTLGEVGLFADGAAVRVVGEETYRICKEVVDEVIQVSTDEICAAIKDSFQDTRAIVEPAGALALAGLKKYASLHPPKPNERNSLLAVLSGANMDFDRLRFVTERARLGEGIEAFLSVGLPERPGAFWEMIQCILPLAISEFTYRYGDANLAKVFISILITDKSDLAAVMERLTAGGYPAEDLSGNELAKSHARYLIGGRAFVPDERVYRFEFPERPGALAKFLQTMRPGQNITLFHYRGQGGDVGRVLVGIQGEGQGIKDFVEELGYPYVDETENPVVKEFLQRGD